MAMSIAQACMNNVRATLKDPEPGTYWQDSELIGYYNQFVTAAISEKQDLLTQTITFNVAPGVDQVLPSNGVQVLGMPANVPSPLNPRSFIRRTTEDAMADADPYWYGQPPMPFVRHFIPHKNDPLRFKVYPPNDGTGQVYLSYAYAPNDAVLVSDNFTLTEAYRDAAYHYIVSKAWGKSDAPVLLAEAAKHETLFQRAIAEAAAAEALTQAKTQVTGSPQRNTAE